MSTKLQSFFRFLYLLRVEPFMLVFVTFYYFRRTPLEVLIQDKLCRNKYNMSDEFCLHLPYMRDNEPDIDIKTSILSDAVLYNTYHTWITVTPGITWSLFLGPWIDKYPKARQFIFIIGSFTQILEATLNTFNSYYFDLSVNWILVSFIPYTLSGAMSWTTAYSYVSAITPLKYRTLRMTILEVVLALAQPLGVFFSGKLINLSPVGGNGQLHNYGLIFLMSSCVNLLCLLWAVFVINQRRDAKLWDQYFGENGGKIISKPRNSEISIKSNTSDNKYKDIHPLRLLFNLNNVKEIVMTCCRRRPGYVRAQIWLVIMAQFCTYFLWAAPASFLFQFVEKVYNWDCDQYSQYQSIGTTINPICVLLLAPVLIRVFKLNDMILSILGFCSSFTQMLILGIMLSPTGYFIGTGANCMGSLGAVGFKAHLGKIVEHQEIGKVFTLMAVVDGAAPLIASAIFTVLFKATIDTFPGTCFLLLAGVAIVPVFIAMSIDFINRFKVKPIIESLSDSESHNYNNNYEFSITSDSIPSEKGSHLSNKSVTQL